MIWLTILWLSSLVESVIAWGLIKDPLKTEIISLEEISLCICKYSVFSSPCICTCSDLVVWFPNICQWGNLTKTWRWRSSGSGAHSKTGIISIKEISLCICICKYSVFPCWVFVYLHLQRTGGVAATHQRLIQKQESSLTAKPISRETQSTYMEASEDYILRNHLATKVFLFTVEDATNKSALNNS